MDHRHLSAATLAALALATAGCGGGDGNKDQGGALSKKDYIAQADKICQESNDRILEVKAPTSATEVVSYVNKALPEVDRAISRLKGLKPADEIRPAAQKLIADLGQQREIIRKVGDAAKKRDVSALTKVTSEGTQIAQATETRARAAGFETCGIQQSAG